MLLTTVKHVLSVSLYEAVIVDYWKRIPKESFQNWYKSQSRYRTKEDREKDALLEDATITMPEMAQLLGTTRSSVYTIDCMPSLGMMTINALVSSDSVLIPVQAAYLPVKGLQQLIKTILTVKKRLNRKLAIEGILLTMVDFRTNYARDIASRVHITYGVNSGIARYGR